MAVLQILLTLKTMVNLNTRKMFEIIGKAVYENEVLYDKLEELTKKVEKIEEEQKAKPGTKEIKKTG